MKVYAPPEGFTKEEMDRGWWVLYTDVKCIGCLAEYAASCVGGIGGKCPRCGQRCI